MKPQSIDTHEKMEQVQINLIRQASIAKRILTARSLTQSAIRLSRRAIQKANPHYTEPEINSSFITYNYGLFLANRFDHSGESMKNYDLLAAIQPIVAAFDQLGVQYSIGGSVASSAFGIPRTTLDVDMVSDLKTEHVNQLVSLLEPSYSIDTELILEAIHSRSSFNLIHLDTMLKIDVFILKNESYYEESFQRRRKEQLDENEEDQSNIQFYLFSPEDVILHKLNWYRNSQSASEHQWNDVLGVLKVQRRSLNIEYIRHWALKLNLTHLVEQSFHDAGVGNDS